MARNVEVLTADPAANTELQFVAPYDLVVHGLSFQLASDGTAATRVVSLVADDGADAWFYSVSPFGQTASQTTRYTAIEGIQHTQVTGFVSDGKTSFAFPQGGLQLRAGDRLRTETTARQVGDNFTAMVLHVERL